MNILHINTVLGRGGAGKVVQTLMKEQTNLGHSVSAIVAWNYRDYSTNLKNSISEVYPSVQTPNYLWPDYNIESSFEILKSEYFNKADVIHLHNIHGNFFNPLTLLPISLKKPIVWTLHDMESLTGHCTNSIDCNNWKTGCGSCPYLTLPKKLDFDNTKELFTAKQEIYSHSSFSVISPSNWLYKIANEIHNSSHQIYRIENPIDKSEFKRISRNNACNYLGISRDAIYIGMVSEGGINNPFKGAKTFIKTINTLNTKFSDKRIIGLIIGDDNDFHITPNIIVLSRATSPKKMSAFYSVLSIYTSTSIAENYPLSILEAMLLKVPVIGSDIGGIGELINNNCGLIVENNNSENFVDAIIFLLSNPKITNNYSNNAYQNAINHNSKQISNKYINVYKSQIASFNSTPDKHSKNEIVLNKQPKNFINNNIKKKLFKWNIIIK